MASRLALKDSAQEIVVKMCDGNPGACRVLLDLLDEPTFEGVGCILNLDSLEIYGSDIWLAYKDVCGQNIPALIEKAQNDGLGLVAAVAVAR